MQGSSDPHPLVLPKGKLELMQHRTLKQRRDMTTGEIQWLEPDARELK